MKPSSSLLTQDASRAIAEINAQYWPNRRQARRRAARGLRAGEVALLARYAEELTGDVLELGATGDRLTAALAHHANSLLGVGVSAPTSRLCRERHPHAKFLEQNLTDLDVFDDGQFQAVVAGRFALDLLGDGQRRRLLDQVCRVLAPNGVLIFSSHNLACESLVPSPARAALTRPWRLPLLPQALANRALLGRLQQRERGYALLNDIEANFGLLHYFIDRDGQERQLNDVGLTLLECVSPRGEQVPPGCEAYGERELYYVAKPGLDQDPGTENLL
ncbi:MAG: class I SAM-dependent methyltransferase [Solirubrobacterales bacterium]|nr:class I SAM-dependent methyltransferase [Solirubrobacterales bacterium]